MVGVAGRSKGCKTCRRRRVKCDEGKPTCDRCRKAKIQCDGYVQFAEFINVSERDAGKPLAKRKAYKPRALPVTPVSDISDVGENSNSSSQEWIDLSLQPFSVLGPLFLNPSWDEQMIFTSHLMQRLFSWSEDPASPFSASWIQVLLCDLEKSNELSQYSISALSTSFFGKVHADYRLMQKGASHYARALRALQIQLQDPKGVLEDFTLMAVLVMAIYEMVASEHPSGWLNHYKGLARLVILRGPYRHQTGAGYSVFSTLRSCLSVGFIVERKRFFLENLEWKTIPWAIKGLDAKLPLHELHDIMVDIPGILEDIDRLIAWDPKVPGRKEFRDNYAHRVFETLNQLYTWYWDWLQKFPHATFKLQSTDLDPETALPLPQSPFESIFWFTVPYRGAELITYNALRLILMICLELLGLLSPTPPSPEKNDPLWPMQGTRHDIAVEICRMADYHLHSCRRSSGAFVILFPLNVALVHLDPEATDVKMWLRKTMARVADGYGFEVGRDEINRQVHDRVLVSQKNRTKKLLY